MIAAAISMLSFSVSMGTAKAMAGLPFRSADPAYLLLPWPYHALPLPALRAYPHRHRSARGACDLDLLPHRRVRSALWPRNGSLGLQLCVHLRAVVPIVSCGHGFASGLLLCGACFWGSPSPTASPRFRAGVAIMNVVLILPHNRKARGGSEPPLLFKDRRPVRP